MANLLLIAMEQSSLLDEVLGIEQHPALDGAACVGRRDDPGLKDRYGPVFIEGDMEIETRDIVAVEDCSGNPTAIVDRGGREECKPRGRLIIERNIMIAKLLGLGRNG